MKLSKTQEEAVRRMHGTTLERRAGGFWTTPEMHPNGNGAPLWYVTKATVDALEVRGVVEVVGTGAPWKAPRRLTAIGNQLSEGLVRP